MTETQAPEPTSRRRPKRFLSPSQKYEIYLQLVRQEVTIAAAGAAVVTVRVCTSYAALGRDGTAAPREGVRHRTSCPPAIRR